jgi:hypothetical protein
MCHDNDELALIASDFVMRGELFPYYPHERVKNVSGSVKLPLRSSFYGEDLIVAIQRSAFLSIEKPQFSMSDTALADLKCNVCAWCDVMV